MLPVKRCHRAVFYAVSLLDINNAVLWWRIYWKASDITIARLFNREIGQDITAGAILS